ncbi:MAG: hypothetical protein Q4B68_01190 [Bacteroidales bacterium]|nr:hypothetical protein [Bacteroidales bacterium]
MWQAVYYRHFDARLESAFVHHVKSIPYCVACATDDELQALKLQLKKDGFTCVESEGDAHTILINLELKKWCKKPTSFNVDYQENTIHHTPEFITTIYTPWKTKN